jgi:hypothetical protein
MKLSLQVSILDRRVISGGDARRAISAAREEARPIVGSCATETPSRCKARVKRIAAARAGWFTDAPSRRPRLTTSAERSGDSFLANEGFQPGAVRASSKYDSSPTIRPVTVVIPRLRTACARPLRPLVVRVGSP